LCLLLMNEQRCAFLRNGKWVWRGIQNDSKHVVSIVFSAATYYMGIFGLTLFSLVQQDDLLSWKLSKVWIRSSLVFFPILVSSSSSSSSSSS
jgi:hypothetical protein